MHGTKSIDRAVRSFTSMHAHSFSARHLSLIFDDFSAFFSPANSDRDRIMHRIKNFCPQFTHYSMQIRLVLLMLPRRIQQIPQAMPQHIIR
jgi:hypothetical protein